MKYSGTEVIKFIQAFEAGKKIICVSDRTSKVTDINNVEELLLILATHDVSVRRALEPEPKKHWLITDKNGGTVIFIDEDKANAARAEWDKVFLCNAPHTLEEYVQVMP